MLPFENLSSDPENAFLSDGVQDEVLNDLAKIADLKVISRTSVMQYKSGGKRNLRQIANELGVAHVVEGSVQRAANRIRVSAQLIDTKTDTHLWAESYDRPLDDVFAIQSEIAKAIAGQLQAKLSPMRNLPSRSDLLRTPPLTTLYVRAKSLVMDTDDRPTRTISKQHVYLIKPSRAIRIFFSRTAYSLKRTAAFTRTLTTRRRDAT